MSNWQILISISLAVFVCTEGRKVTEATLDTCEVCVTYMGKFIDYFQETKGDITESTPSDIEDTFRKFCKDARKDDDRFCYYVGGKAESATGMLNRMSKPLSWGMPADKVCMKLYKMDEQICDLKYEKQIDLSAVNLKKLKVKDLKAILSDWDEQCRGCTEKDDFVKLIEELMPKYNKESWEKRQKMEL